MKTFKKGWENDIVTYMFKTYECNVNTGCSGCNFYEDMYISYKDIIANNNNYNIKYKHIHNSSYVTTKNDEIIHMDSIPKLCKNICIFYY